MQYAMIKKGILPVTYIYNLNSGDVDDIDFVFCLLIFSVKIKQKVRTRGLQTSVQEMLMRKSGCKLTAQFVLTKRN